MRNLLCVFISCVLFTSAGCSLLQKKQVSFAEPTVITPADRTNEPPSDAIILFNGSDTSEWVSADKSSPVKWKVENGFMEVIPKTGPIFTKRSFGSCQMHIEWAAPAEVKGDGQNRGNSGIFFMNNYELQVLDSYQNKTYPDGQAGAIYSQSSPMVNASKKPGEWQTYDVIFHRPLFKGKKCVKPATFTVFQNGVLIQDNFAVEGVTFLKPSHYVPHADKEPLQLQDHNCLVRYRNIWIRELPESK